ncbi:hypothetical protein M408DRAFT_328314 [Serendipita vermifera MAFF 305830]|uniref:Uncharacterized protein n=1 Tax=Serendipita vermifera MAFF 305830 TaxID=933852 RepID=A0A0C3B0H9_SERVB|nr:hypothetical protein M408DRAFT_328314 [Serendipita vermifera MAFF 305830]
MINSFWLNPSDCPFLLCLSDLPFIGESCCGSNGCRDLWTHLEAIWHDQRVLEAKKIDGVDVRLEKFDDTLLNARKNQLVVKVAMR